MMLEIDFDLDHYYCGRHAGLDPASRNFLHYSSGFRLEGRNDVPHSE